MFESLRQFVKEVPVLAELLERALLDDPGHSTNTEDLRFHIEGLQAKLWARLKAEKQLYAVMHFPEHEQSCAICKESFLGYYWELNNPVTNKGLTITNRLLHGLVSHEQLFCVESMHNVSGTRVGETRLVMDLAALAKVLEGAKLPEGIREDFAAAQVLQAQQLAESGAAAVAGGGH